MNQDQIYEKLNKVFCDIFDDSTIVVKKETKASDIDAWDSLTHISLIAAIEQEFGTSFSMKEVMNFKEVGDIVNLLSNKL